MQQTDPRSRPPRARAAVVALLTALAVLVGLATPAAAADGSITGSVTNGGSPVAGAQVTAIGDSDAGVGFTDAGGSYTIPALAPGVYVVTVEAAGFVVFSGNATVPDGGSVTFNAALAPLPTLSGTITDPCGDPVVGAVVLISGGEGEEQVTTGAAGTYQFLEVKSGDYLMTVEAPDGSGLDDFSVGPFAVQATNIVRDVSLTGTVTCEEGGQYVALQPARILDTRRTDLELDGTFGAGQTRDLTVTDLAGVPADAEAVVLNVTVTGGSAASNLRLWPAGEPQPQASNLNWEAGQTTPNLVKVKVGAGGKVSIRNQSGTVHVIGDVQGYYGDSGNRYNPLTPSRIMDTRRTDLELDGTFGPAQTRNLTVTNIGGVPADAAAVILNVTVTGGTSGSDLRLWPAGETQPQVSNLNFVPGQTVPNLVMVKVGASGRVSIRNQAGNVHVIADVVGYFSGGGELYTAIQPSRILDTRRTDLELDGTFGPGQTRDLTVTDLAGVPAGAEAVVINVTVVSGSAPSDLRLWPAGEAQPQVSNLNWPDGRAIPNLVAVKVGAGGKVSIRNQSGTVHVIGDVVGYWGA